MQKTTSFLSSDFRGAPLISFSGSMGGEQRGRGLSKEEGEVDKREVTTHSSAFFISATNTSLSNRSPFPLPSDVQNDQQQRDEPEEQQEPPAAHPVMSDELWNACATGDVGVVERLLTDGESVNSVDEQPGHTPIMIAMMLSQLAVVQVLADRGADLSIIRTTGRNLLHLLHMVVIVSASSGCLLIPLSTSIQPILIMKLPSCYL
jgi:hypothetical protein